MEYFAHSPKDGYPAQTYAQHINGVSERARRHASDAARYSLDDGALLLTTAEVAAVYHDLGKLDGENQSVLSGQRAAKRLPLNHTDAGAAFLLDDVSPALLAAVSVAAHHIGLPDFGTESIREESAFRDDEIKTRVDAALLEYSQIHSSNVSTRPQIESAIPSGDLSVFLRMLLSCLVDADHTDTASHYGKYPEAENSIPLRPAERLALLDHYVETLRKTGEDDERNKLRSEMYAVCRDSLICENIAACDAPVGSGKTTAVMAHLLAQANTRGLRRIFIVLPFTNIIQQSVEKYREALVFPGENGEEVVAELHHRAEFESEDTRHLTALWRAPIIVTTAVAFFETLAAKTPSALRRMHELAGSAVFVDEAHGALPAHLLPLAWRWINIYAKEWSCYWILASGSLNQFWEIKEISEQKLEVPNIVNPSLRASLNAFEGKRIEYQANLTPQSLETFVEVVAQSQGPRLVILNTVQSAAVVAEYICEKYGRGRVEHLSTSLTPSDREKTLGQVKARLNRSDDDDWTLVATSCVEAGVDFSFRTGFRELASLTSLLQAAGRVNRNGEYGVSEMHTFCLSESNMLKSNPDIKNSAAVLRKLIETGVDISPSLTTEAIEQELKIYGSKPIHRKLLEKEIDKDFPFVEENFKVINTDTRIAVADTKIVDRIRNGHCDWHELQKHSLQISHYKLQELHIPQITEDIYHWNLAYDDFLGYMAGIIQKSELKLLMY
ncbi:CRISPR-associated endonuclease Cas3'' [Methanoculleus chikugoensis]|nr:CRISPR-associated endonuclease Cas3'' [Methanoculleus chikugoensis]